MPSDLPATVAALENAVNNGTISEARINESVRRILNLKYKYGILQF
jgi:beta-N-acetylhexosaminidase